MLRFTVDLSAPVGPLFVFLSDPRNRQKWQSSILSLSMLDEGEPRVGMRWKETARGFGSFEMHITEHQPNERWAEHGSSGRGEIDLTLEFESLSDPEKTRLTVLVDLKLKGLFRGVAPMAGVFLAPLMKADLRRAAELAKTADSSAF